MKKSILFVVFSMFMVFALASSAPAYNITDPANDAIGTRTYESYGANVYNFTPGVNSGGIKVELFTNYPQAGETVNGNPPWTTLPADLFITETYNGSLYKWAVPLVNHGAFIAGNFYAVGTSKTSTQMDPSGGTGYIYNKDVPVWIDTLGNNYGYSEIDGGSVAWSQLSGSPDFVITIILGVYEDDPNGIFRFDWGTATCANDIISGQVPNAVPEPVTMLTLGIGFLGVAYVRSRMRKCIPPYSAFG